MSVRLFFGLDVGCGFGVLFGVAVFVGFVGIVFILGVSGVGFDRGLFGVEAGNSTAGEGVGRTERFEFSFVELLFDSIPTFEFSDEFAIDSILGSGDGENSGVGCGDGLGCTVAPA
jgi:hypothetical protein